VFRLLGYSVLVSAHPSLLPGSSSNLTHCIYMSKPSSHRNTLLEVSLATHHNLRSVWHVEPDVLGRARDVPFVLAPSGEDTRHVVNAGCLRKMEKHGTFTM
jgi:glyoxylate/hydroxypyruvate reductase